MSENGEESRLSALFKKIGVTTTSVVNNRVVEFLVDRYVNWTTESQRLFRRVIGIFLAVSVIGGGVLVYLTTFEKHHRIHAHNTMYQMLKKYVIKKDILEKRLASLQAGRGDVLKSMEQAQVMSVLKKNDVLEENAQIDSSSAEKTEGFSKKEFNVRVSRMTYPQVLNVLYDVETLGTNVHVDEVKITQEGLEKGFYAMQFRLAVFEPMIAAQTTP